MSDRTPDEPSRREEDDALQDALAAEHAAIWGHAVMGAVLPGEAAAVSAGERAHRAVRDQLEQLLDERGLLPVPPEAGYTLPFPVLSTVDGAALGVTLEEGVSRAFGTLLGRAALPATRELAVTVLTDSELRAVAWRTRAGKTPVTTPFPGL